MHAFGFMNISELLIAVLKKSIEFVDNFSALHVLTLSTAIKGI